MALQTGLYPVHKRQLILIDDENSNNHSAVPKVKRIHHPIIMLKNSNDTATNILMEVACHDGSVIKNNIFRTHNSEWIREGDLAGSYPTERFVVYILLMGKYFLHFCKYQSRICNSGNLPLHGRTVRASVFGLSPWVYTDENRELTGGVVVDMFKVIAEHLEFDFEIVLRSNWFKVFANGTIGESLGDVSL